MPLGSKVGLDPSDIVLDGEMETKLSPPRKGSRAPNFRPISSVATRLEWIDQDAT